MPIRPEFRPLYPANWRALSHQVRFQRAGGKCEGCGRPHGAEILCLPDGRWFDPDRQTWRDGRGRPARWPDLLEAISRRTTRVVLATAHRDHNPAHNRLRNLRALCQRCHLLHDRSQHRRQRWITCRRRYALGDLFLGLYAELILTAMEHHQLTFALAASSWPGSGGRGANGPDAHSARPAMTDLQESLSMALDVTA